MEEKEKEDLVMKVQMPAIQMSIGRMGAVEEILTARRQAKQLKRTRKAAKAVWMSERTNSEIGGRQLGNWTGGQRDE